MIIVLTPLKGTVSYVSLPSLPLYAVISPNLSEYLPLWWQISSWDYWLQPGPGLQQILPISNISFISHKQTIQLVLCHVVILLVKAPYNGVGAQRSQCCPSVKGTIRNSSKLQHKANKT